MHRREGQRRVVIYGRVSLDRGATKSVDDQLTELRQWATREGWHVVGEYRDDGISASPYANGRARPGWQRAMDDIEADRVDALLVWDFSRASRDDKVTAALKAVCVERNVQIGYGGMLRDPATADGSFYVGLDGLIAAKYSADLSEKTRRGKASSAGEGKPAGTVPYGYRRKLDPVTGKAIGREKHPEQAAVVQEIARRLLARESSDSIAADLNRRGIPTGTGDRWLGRHLRAVERAVPEHPIAREIAERLDAGQAPRTIAEDLNERGVEKPVPSGWRGSNLMKMVLRPTYAGLRVFQGEVLDEIRGQWPAILTEEEHQLLVAMHRDPARDKFRNPTNVKHLGSGIYRCGREGCRGVMRIVAHYGHRPNHYDCRACHKVSRDQARVDELVEGAIWRRLTRPDILELLAHANGDDTEAKEAGEEARRLWAKLKAARLAWDEDRISLEAYSDMEARTMPRIREAEERARPKATPPLVLEVAGPDAEQKWGALSVGEKRSIASSLVDVTILPIGRTRKPFDPRDVQIVWKG